MNIILYGLFVLNVLIGLAGLSTGEAPGLAVFFLILAGLMLFFIIKRKKSGVNKQKFSYVYYNMAKIPLKNKV